MNGSRSDAEIEAGRWIARLEAEDVTLDDHDRFRAWLAVSPENQAAYQDMSRTWDKLDRLPPTGLERPAPRSRNRRTLLLAGAGVAALAAAGVILAPALLRGEGVRYRTGVGQRSSITLPDGSEVELNAMSDLRVRLSEGQRYARLTDGEALFDVRPDANRPFVVETPFGELRVLGTSFVVRIGPAGARASVISGRVEAAPARTIGAEMETIIAGAGEEIALTRDAVETMPLPQPALERRLAWRSGMLAFDGETLAEAAFEVERQTGVRFEFASAELAEMRVGGYINATDVDAFADLITNNLGLEVDRRSAQRWMVRAQ